MKHLSCLDYNYQGYRICKENNHCIMSYKVNYLLRSSVPYSTNMKNITK